MNKNKGKNKNDKIHKREKKKSWHNFMIQEIFKEADGGDTTIMIYYVKYIYIHIYVNVFLVFLVENFSFILKI